MTFQRVTFAEWDIDVDTPEGHRLLDIVRSDGLALFRRQPGFIRYRLVRLGPSRTIALAEWDSEELALAGAARYRSWLETAGLMAHITLTTESGPVLISSDAEGT